MRLQDVRKGTTANSVEFVCRVIILAAGLFVLTRNVTGEFTGWHENNSATIAVFARNHIYYGLGYTKLFNTWGETAEPPATPQRYLNHPPLLSLFAAVPMLIFGDHEWVARSVPIATTLGSVLLLMIIISRLQSPTLGLLSGLFYVMLPATAYFGRMLCHESPVQFFSLLMLHGYLQWTGIYGGEYSRKPGALCYSLGTILGIGTGWAAIIMATLIWLWHLGRAFRNNSQRKTLLWLTIIPVASFTAVAIHLLWGYEWNVSWFVPLFLKRTIGLTEPAWKQWFFKNQTALMQNVTILGVAAAIIYAVIIAAALRRTDVDSPLRKIVRSKQSVIPILLTLLQGTIWVVGLKHQSWMHDYWQYLMMPFFAVGMASVVTAAFVLLSEMLPRTAKPIAVLLILLSMPAFAEHLDLLHQKQFSKIHNAITVFNRISQLAPPRAPIIITVKYTTYTPETLGSYTSNRYDGLIVYYANRPLIYSTNIDQIEAYRKERGVCIVLLTNAPALRQLTQQLNDRYEMEQVNPNTFIYLLNQPKQINHP